MKERVHKYIIGIDEVGRGPLAGPVAVGVAMATKETIRKWRKIKESKQLTPKQREEWYTKICAPESGIISAVTFVSAKMIDKNGINPSIQRAMLFGLKKINPNPTSVCVLLDGGLRAPLEFVNQETIIHGDAKETIIAIASVVAKVERDRLMVKMDKKFPKYGFAQHKGYGTKAHILAIKKFRLSSEHRQTYCKNFLS